MSPCESIWRIFAFDIHMRWPAIQKLNSHLPNNEFVCFGDQERIDYVFARKFENRTLFFAWMNTNVRYPEAQKFTYQQFREYFVFNNDLQKWRPRKNGLAIGRLNFFFSSIWQVVLFKDVAMFKLGALHLTIWGLTKEKYMIHFMMHA